LQKGTLLWVLLGHVQFSMVSIVNLIASGQQRCDL